MNLILKRFKEDLIKEKNIEAKIANIRLKKISKVLDDNCTIKYTTNIDDLNEEMLPKVKEIILEEIDELIKEKNLKVKEIDYISIYSQKKHVTDVFINCEFQSILYSFEVFAKRENMSMEYFEDIQKENISPDERVISFVNDKNEKVTRKYITLKDEKNTHSSTCFEIIKNNSSVKLKNIASDEELILNEVEYDKLSLKNF